MSFVGETLLWLSGFTGAGQSMMGLAAVGPVAAGERITGHAENDIVAADPVAVGLVDCGDRHTFIAKGTVTIHGIAIVPIGAKGTVGNVQAVGQKTRPDPIIP